MIEKQCEKEMNSILSKFNEDIKSYRTYTLSPDSLHKIVVQVGDQFYKLNHISSISNIDRMRLNINVWDSSNTKSVVKAINKENMGLSLSESGNSIIVTRPPMSEEYRNELKKQIKKDGEKYKQSVRLTRQKYNKKCDVLNNPNSVKKKIQELTDGKCFEIENKINDRISQLEK